MSFYTSNPNASGADPVHLDLPDTASRTYNRLRAYPVHRSSNVSEHGILVAEYYPSNGGEYAAVAAVVPPGEFLPPVNFTAVTNASNGNSDFSAYSAFPPGISRYRVLICWSGLAAFSVMLAHPCQRLSGARLDYVRVVRPRRELHRDARF